MEIAGQDYASAEDYYRRIRILRGLSGEQRLELALQMWETAREVTRAGIKAQHPEYTDEQIGRELAARIMIANGAAGTTASHC